MILVSYTKMIRDRMPHKNHFKKIWFANAKAHQNDTHKRLQINDAILSLSQFFILC